MADQKPEPSRSKGCSFVAGILAVASSVFFLYEKNTLIKPDGNYGEMIVLLGLILLLIFGVVLLTTMTGLVMGIAGYKQGDKKKVQSNLGLFLCLAVVIFWLGVGINFGISTQIQKSAEKATATAVQALINRDYSCPGAPPTRLKNVLLVVFIEPPGIQTKVYKTPGFSSKVRDTATRDLPPKNWSRE